MYIRKKTKNRQRHGRSTRRVNKMKEGYFLSKRSYTGSAGRVNFAEMQCTPWAIKKRATFIFLITLANIDGFSQFFNCCIQEGIVE